MAPWARGWGGGDPEDRLLPAPRHRHQTSGPAAERGQRLEALRSGRGGECDDFLTGVGMCRPFLSFF